MNRCLMVLLVLAMLTIGVPAMAESNTEDWFGKSEAQSPPVQVMRGTSYWWWPTDAKSNADDGEQWGNRGTVFGKMSPPLPPPPIQEQPPVIEEPVVEAVDPFAEEPVVEAEEIQIAKVPEPEPEPVIPEPEPEPVVEEEELPVEEPVQVAEVVEEVIPEPTRTIPIFSNVLFDFDKSVLTPEGNELLAQVIANLQEYVHDTLSIEGHTDNINRSGHEEYNVLLGQRRADAVLKVLLEGGIDASRVTAMSRGDTEPAVGNDSEANRAMNRRVLFKYSIGD